MIDLSKFISGKGVYKTRFFPPIVDEKTGNSLSLKQAVDKGFTTRTMISGFLINPMSWSASNSWSGLHSGLESMKGAFGENYKKTETLLHQAGWKDSGQTNVQGITETIARYEGSQKPTFGFNLMLVSLDPEDNIIEDCKAFLAGCYPKSAKAGMMEAPYGYRSGFTGGADDMDMTNFNNKNSAAGCWDVVVGNWFRCPQLVMDSCNINFSQQCTYDGKPLFAEVQLTFETWRLITADELKSFFFWGGDNG